VDKVTALYHQNSAKRFCMPNWALSEGPGGKLGVGQPWIRSGQNLVAFCCSTEHGRSTHVTLPAQANDFAVTKVPLNSSSSSTSYNNSHASCTNLPVMINPCALCQAKIILIDGPGAKKSQRGTRAGICDGQSKDDKRPKSDREKRSDS
jgi:hypothetical protein